MDEVAFLLLDGKFTYADRFSVLGNQHGVPIDYNVVACDQAQVVGAEYIAFSLVDNTNGGLVKTFVLFEVESRDRFCDPHPNL